MYVCMYKCVKNLPATVQAASVTALPTEPSTVHAKRQCNQTAVRFNCTSQTNGTFFSCS